MVDLVYTRKVQSQMQELQWGRSTLAPPSRNPLASLALNPSHPGAPTLALTRRARGFRSCTLEKSKDRCRFSSGGNPPSRLPLATLSPPSRSTRLTPALPPSRSPGGRFSYGLDVMPPRKSSAGSSSRSSTALKKRKKAVKETRNRSGGAFAWDNSLVPPPRPPRLVSVSFSCLSTAQLPRQLPARVPTPLATRAAAARAAARRTRGRHSPLLWSS